jgi:tetratricopeptide (TPR) repeat protein
LRRSSRLAIRLNPGNNGVTFTTFTKEFYASIPAAAHATKGDFGGAIKIMEKAAAIVDSLPPPGPPPLVKPVHELFGEILLNSGRADKAAERFAISLSRHPNRARSLLGAARAFAHIGDAQRAAKFYAQLAQQWRQASAELPELREARNYTKQADARALSTR